MALQQLDSATASTDPAYRELFGERTRIVAARDSAWRAVRDAREQATTLSQMIPVQGADAVLTEKLNQARAQVIQSERKLTQLEGQMSDADAALRTWTAEASLKAGQETAGWQAQQGRSGAISDVVQAGRESYQLARKIYRASDAADAGEATARPAPAGHQEPRPKKRSPQIKALLQRFQLSQSSHTRNRNLREKEKVSIMKGIKKTAFLVVGFALFIATACDILSFFDLGWILSWTIPIISWFMVRRINSIMKSPERIVHATNRLRRESILLRQRVLPLLPPVERATFLAGERIGRLSGAAASYISTWVRDSIITQLLELIPVVDILPMYLGQVVKMILNQNIEYQKVRKLTPAYDRAIAVVDNLELVEIEQLGRRLVALTGQQNIETPRPRESVADVTRPGSRVAGLVRPVQQRPVPIAAVPMRDVAAAA